MTLPFDTEQFLAVFALYNAAIWPAQLGAYAMGLFALAALFMQNRMGVRVILAVLAAMWAWNGLVYHIAYFASINAAAYGFGALFLLQAALLAYYSWKPDDTSIVVRGDRQSIVALSFVIYALVVYQVLGVVAGHGLMKGPIFGVAPCPTTIFTIGLLLLGHGHPVRLLAAIPLAWAAIGTSAAVLLGIPEDFGLGVAGAMLAMSLAVAAITSKCQNGSTLFQPIGPVAIIVVGVLVYLSYNHEVSDARAAVSSDRRIAITMAGSVEYAEKGSGIPLLSIHGAGGGYDQGLSNAADLVGNEYRIIAPSRFGYLGTLIPVDASPSAQADALAALLAELSVDKAVVVGISAGARSAVELALRHPDKVAALVLMVPGTYSPTSPVTIEASRGSQFAFWLVNSGADFAWWATQKIAPSVLIRFIGVPPEVVAAASKVDQARVKQIVKNIQPLSLRFAGINIDSNPDLHQPPLQDISTPTLIISARDDLFNTVPAAEFAASNIPNAELVLFDTGGHLLVGHDREVRAIVGGFLARANVSLLQ